MLAEGEGYEFIRGWLSDRCGMSFPEKKRDLLVHRLNRVLMRFELPDFDELAREMTHGKDTELQLAVIHAASTNHTFFFREPNVLEYFRDNILVPGARSGEFRVWSAAASSGDEAFTLAIMALETLGPAGSLARLHLGNRHQRTGNQPGGIGNLQRQPSGACPGRYPAALFRACRHGPVPGRSAGPQHVHLPPA